jgi:malonate-semialdehyde dehydrogenase (acetylating)/methylmalonate-semialdehyde dehydrogenase
LSQNEKTAFYNRVVDAFVSASSRIKLGYGLDDTVHLGPLRDEKKKLNVLRYIESGLADGATLRRDGREFDLEAGYPETCFVGPTVFEDVTPDMAIAREEIFGPVGNMMKADSLSQAIDLIHDNPYGNAASIFTQNGKWTREFQYSVACGNIGVNVGIAAPMAFFPFSGMKDSFFGTLHGQGQEAIRFFTESKVVIQRWF